MRAIAIEEFGGSDKLQLVDLPTPEPGSDEVLIRVRAAGVGPWDVMSRQGVFGDREFPFVPGFEPAGVVETVGDDVEDFSEGDEVYAYRFPGGGYAEYVTAAQAITAHKPSALSFEEAAGLPVAGTTAHQGLVDELGVQEGETVLITGASGGVGSMAVQIAANVIGARVIGTASTRNHEYLRELGAEDAIDYNGDWVTTVREIAPDGVDAVLECAGGDTLERSFETLRDEGRAAYIVPVEEEPEPPRRISAHFFSAQPDGDRLSVLASMFDEGQLRMNLQEVVPLEEAARAHEIVEEGHTRGKIVLGIR
ncbi:MAG: NADP-dependent oxidoreductase [Rubrobacteraceae bacterium]